MCLDKSNDPLMNEFYQNNWLQFYSRVAPTYARKVKLFLVLVGGQNRFYSRCARLLDLRQDSRLLDIGCGTGAFVRAVDRSVELFSAGNAIDLCPDMIGIASKSAIPRRLSFSQMDATNLEFGECSFDRVSIIGVLHELPFTDRTLILKEAYRVLSPGGKLLVAEHFISKQKFKRYLQTIVFRVISKEPERSTSQDMMRNGVENEIKAVGFKILGHEVCTLPILKLVVARKEQQMWPLVQNSQSSFS